MIDTALSDRLAELDARIGARMHDLRERGEFSDVHAAAFAGIEAQRAEIEKRMEHAVATGAVGSAVLVEVRRDVDALADAFEAMVFSTDTNRS